MIWGYGFVYLLTILKVNNLLFFWHTLYKTNIISTLHLPSLILFLIFLQNQVTTDNILQNFEVVWSLHTENMKCILKFHFHFSLTEDMNIIKQFKMIFDLAKNLTKALNMSKVWSTKLIKRNLPAEINLDS